MANERVTDGGDRSQYAGEIARRSRRTNRHDRQMHLVSSDGVFTHADGSQRRYSLEMS